MAVKNQPATVSEADFKGKPLNTLFETTNTG